MMIYELHSLSSCVSLPGRNLKEWLQEQFCDKPLEQDDMRLHNAAYVGDLDTLRNLLQEDDFKRWEGSDDDNMNIIRRNESFVLLLLLERAVAVRSVSLQNWQLLSRMSMCGIKWFVGFVLCGFVR